MELTNVWRRGWLRIGRLCSRLADCGSFSAVDVSALEWRGGKHRTAAVTLFMKPIFEDPATGTEFKLVRYPAGEINPDHSHDVPHGMYVLQGQLVTHKGTFPAGSFVWFPRNEIMRHGAGPDADVLVLFFSDSQMQTRYAGQTA